MQGEWSSDSPLQGNPAPPSEDVIGQPLEKRKEVQPWVCFVIAEKTEGDLVAFAANRRREDRDLEEPSREEEHGVRSVPRTEKETAEPEDQRPHDTLSHVPRGAWLFQLTDLLKKSLLHIKSYPRLQDDSISASPSWPPDKSSESGNNVFMEADVYRVDLEHKQRRSVSFGGKSIFHSSEILFISDNHVLASPSEGLLFTVNNLLRLNCTKDST
ncbi:uncharacterized protein LOC144798875 [Lissotriton helveticus]